MASTEEGGTLTHARFAGLAGLTGVLLAAACAGPAASGTSASHAPASHRAASHQAASRPAASANPPATPSAPPPPVTIAFAGDVNFEQQVAARLAWDPDIAIGPMASVLARADLAVVNLETAITGRGTPAAKQFVFRAPATAFTALRSAGVDVVTEANNHGMDYGLVGLQDSIAAARGAHFPVVGIGLDDEDAYRPYVTTVRGVRIAVIGATQVLDDNLINAWTAGPGKPGLASAKDIDRLLRAVRETRQQADVVIVDLHWGQELATCPTAPQREIAPALVAAGADVVVGSHAHVLLGAGYLGRAYVDYGLGNFVFYSAAGPAAHSGVLTLTVTGRTVSAASWTPAVVSRGVPQPLSGAAAAAAVADWQRLRSCTGLTPTPTTR
jgi:deoxyinosine 3'endonuclease (endonuclease V)